jgi:hypothetical protein
MVKILSAKKRKEKTGEERNERNATHKQAQKN